MADLAEQVPGWGIALQKDVEGVQHSLSEHIRVDEQTHRDQWTKINLIGDGLNTRLPLWATLAMTILASTTTGLTVALLR